MNGQIMASDLLTLGPFELQKSVGQGGMGEVWRAVHRREETPVAVKIIMEQDNVDVNQAVAFEREVHAAASMTHPEIVQVFDYGVVPEEVEARSKNRLGAGLPYLVMAWADGGSVEEHPPTNWPELQSLLLSVLRALSHAHARQLVHLDIKPANVLLAHAQQTFYQLSDFGIAFAFSPFQTEANQLRASTIMGTPNYMAPEQFLGRWRDFGPWTDLYALGCMCFELVCGQSPFDAQTILALATSHLFEPIPALTPRFDVPDDLERWLERMMAKAPHQRFQHAADAAHALMALDAQHMLHGNGDGLGEPSAFSGTQRLFEHDGNTQTQLLEHLQQTGSIAFDDTMDSANMPRAAVDMSALQKDDPWEDVLPLSLDVAQADAPPCPEDWRLVQDEAQHQPTLMFGTGLSIWGVRALPFVGREQERDVLWSHLRQCAQTGHGRVMAVTGMTGHGKSYLCRWFETRAREIGVANTLRATHHETTSYLDGLGAMLSAHMQCVGLNRQQTFARVQRRIHRVAPTLEVDQVIQQAAMLTQWMHPVRQDHGHDDGVPPVHFSSDDERFEAIAQWLKHLAQHRLVLVTLEDIQHSQESIQFAEYCLEHLSTYPIMVVCTTQEDVAANDMQHFVAHTRVSTLRLGPLSRQAHEHLVRKLLGLAPQEVQRVCDWTEGDPMFAVQLVEDWVERAKLILGPDGFCLDEASEVEIPSSVAQLCAQRLAYAIDQLADSERDTTWRALELAAMLGEDVQQHEWMSVCQMAGLSIAPRTVSTLVHHGLAQHTREGWRFNNRLFAEQLQQHARNNHRWVEHHRHCAMMLMQSTTPHQTTLERAGYHALAAQDFQVALDAFLDVIVMVGITRGEQIIDDLERALMAQPHKVARLHYTTLMLKGRLSILLYQGKIEEARQCLDMLDLLDLPLYVHVEYGLVQAKLCLYEQQYDEGLACIEHVRALLGDQPDLQNHEIWGRLARLHGELLMFSEQPKPAKQQFDAALHHFEQGGFLWRRAWAMHCMAMCYLDMGDFERAEQTTLDCKAIMAQCGDRAGLAACEDNLATLAYEAGDFEVAMSRFLSAETYYASIRDAGVWIARENYARSAIKHGDFDAALQTLKIIREHNDGLQSNVFVNYIEDALLCCYAGLQNRKAWQSTYLSALSKLHKAQHVDALMLDSLMLCLALVIDARWFKEALALGEVLEQLSQGADDPDIHKQLQQQMARLAASL